MAFKLCVLVAVLVAAQKGKQDGNGNDNQNNGNQNVVRPWRHFGQLNWGKDFDDRTFNKRSAQCSLAVFSLDDAPSLVDTLPEIKKLTQIFPLKQFDYRLFTPIPGKPSTEPDFSSWLADLKTNIVAVDAQVAKWRQKRIDYIGLPPQSTFLAPYLTGTVEAENGTIFVVAKGNINQRFDARQQYVLEDPGTPVVDDFGTHIARLSDVNTGDSFLGANLQFFGVLDSPTGPVNPTTKLFYISQNGDGISESLAADLRDFFTSNTLSLAADAIIGIDESGSANPFFNIAQLQAVAANIKAASLNPGINKIVIGPGTSGAVIEETTRDFMNAGIFCECPSGNCFGGINPCTPYPKVVVWGANWSPIPGFTIPIPSSTGLSVSENTTPSIEYTYLGFPRPLPAFSDFASTKNLYSLEQIKWASQCRTIEKTRVAPATFTLSGDEYKFIKSTKVGYWLQPGNFAANSAVAADLDKNFQINPLWIDATP
jgi:hypothetical protein